METNIPPASQMMRMPVAGMNLISPGFPNAIFQTGRMPGGLPNEQ